MCRINDCKETIEKYEPQYEKNVEKERKVVSGNPIRKWCAYHELYIIFAALSELSSDGRSKEWTEHAENWPVTREAIFICVNEKVAQLWFPHAEMI